MVDIFEHERRVVVGTVDMQRRLELVGIAVGGISLHTVAERSVAVVGQPLAEIALTQYSVVTDRQTQSHVVGGDINRSGGKTGHGKCRHSE